MPITEGESAMLEYMKSLEEKLEDKRGALRIAARRLDSLAEILRQDYADGVMADEVSKWAAQTRADANR